MNPLTRDHLSTLPRRRLHAGRNLTKAVVELVEDEDRTIVLKDLSSRPWPVRLLLGPAQLDREARAYRALRDLPGVPRFLGRIDRRAIALEYIAGRDLGAVRPGELPASFFDRLKDVLEGIHARGVAHGDLSRSDILVGPGGEPYVVDFSTSVLAGPDADPLARFLFGQMCLADRRSLLKIRRRVLEDPGGPLPSAPVLYRIGARLKACVDFLKRPAAYLHRGRSLLASRRSPIRGARPGRSNGSADRGCPHQGPQDHPR